MQNTRLKELREKLGYTVAQIIQATDLTLSHYSKLEKDKISNAGITSYIKLADFYGVGLDYLLGRSTQPTIETNIVTYDIIKDIHKFNKINFNKVDNDNIEDEVEIKKVETKILKDIIKKEKVEHSDYPVNILNAIFEQKIVTTNIKIVPTIIRDLELIYNEYLTDRETYIIKMRFIKQLSLKHIGKLLNVTTERIRQIETRAVRKLRRNYIMNMLVYNIDEDIESKKQELNKLKDEINNCKAELEKHNTEMESKGLISKDFNIYELNFSVRTTRCLLHGRINSLEKLVKHTLHGKLFKIRNFGRKSYFEVLNKLQEMKIIKYDNSINNVDDVRKTIRLVRRPFVLINVTG